MRIKKLDGRKYSLIVLYGWTDAWKISLLGSMEKSSDGNAEETTGKYFLLDIDSLWIVRREKVMVKYKSSSLTRPRKWLKKLFYMSRAEAIEAIEDRGGIKFLQIVRRGRC